MEKYFVGRGKKLRLKALVVQLCPTLFEQRSPSGSSVHWISQSRILEWIAIPFFRGSS